MKQTHDKMKCSRLAVLIVLFASLTVIRAQNGISIISQSYNSSASWSDGWSIAGDTTNGLYASPMPYPSAYPVTGGYNLSSSDGTPLTASSIAFDPWGGIAIYASTSISLFSVQNSFYSSGGWAQGNPFQNGRLYVGYGGGGVSSFSAHWVFSSDYNTLEFNMNGYSTGGFGGTSIGLFDDTAGTTLWYSSGVLFGGNTFTVNPGDICELYIVGNAYAYVRDADTYNVQVTTSLSSVPEPSTTIIVMIGLICVFRPARRLYRSYGR